MTGSPTWPGMSAANLAVAVRCADPGRMLPARRAGEQGRLRAPLRLLGAAELGPGSGRWAALVADATGTLLGVPLVASAPQQVRRAVPGDGAAAGLLALLAGADAPAPGFEVVRLHPLCAVGESAVEVDQTHDSVVVGDRDGPGGAVVVKWAVHVQDTDRDPPAVSAMRHLDAVGFTRTPEPVGFLLADSGPGRRALLATATRFVAGALDGWDWYVQDLLEYLEQPDRPASLAAAAAPASELGHLVAAMHVAFATGWSGCPDPVTTARGADRACWLERALQTLAEAVDLTGGDPGRRLRRRAGAAEAALRAGLAGTRETALTRVHGDLHVGQVLRWAGGYAVCDFDGNPVLGAAERADPQPPARDVAGMLRSLDHVGRIADRRTGGSRAAAVDRWATAARAGFLAAYRSGVAGTPGAGGPWDAPLLFALEVEQECRELVYAGRHLPDWTYAPDAGLAALLPVPGEVDDL